MQIDFKKFIKYSEAIKDNPDEQFVLSEMMRLFFQKRKDVENCIIEFEKATNDDAPIRLPWYFKLDLNFVKASIFIDADTFFSEKDFVSFIDTVLSHRVPFMKVKDITLKQASIIISMFREKSVEIKSRFPWIYDPPNFGNATKETVGTIEKQNFIEHYGGYMEIIYLLCKEDLTRADIVTNWELERFLFQGEYLLRKRIIENLK